jgi:hypothetical protein
MEGYPVKDDTDPEMLGNAIKKLVQGGMTACDAADRLQGVVVAVSRPYPDDPERPKGSGSVAPPPPENGTGEREYMD